MRLLKSLLITLVVVVMLAACSASGDNPGREYAPNMYHSVPYEPYKQITDKDAGRWVTSIEYEDGHAEFYNSNNLNPHRMTMRLPAPNTVKRNRQGNFDYLPYRIQKDSLEDANNLRNPLDSTAAVLADGKALYDMYCKHCHGGRGAGDGKVADKYAGVANLQGDAYKGMTEGHIFHVITHGKGLMWAHGSQINQADRWKIAKYVKTLQQ